MTGYAPPSKYTGTPQLTVLPAGTVLSRIHLDAYPPTSFNPVEADLVFGGGRFDGTEADPYPYMYLGEGDATAVGETLLRDLEPRDNGVRFLPKAVWTGRRLSRVGVASDLKLITLVSSTDLGAVGADPWLVQCGPDDYAKTRAWARWLRTQVPDAAGIVWSSKRELGTRSFVLFGDRCPGGVVSPRPGPLAGDCTFDSPEGCDWLRQHLVPYRVAIRRS